ncbi:hypothetical protein T265_09015 [Opisthorchis viverrini]|uniref:Reverse transcriptase domain-containing protein n=1 Tax=Opisthorchis viverrini TaxID=6198 RepID=A0A074Z742_OPIVI|nr:hypothetical protein T265_09015 [Opisthorchis viverrini]KER23006.1 hypothetical protein T265_09015 [Opisthorchis viverrini]
MEGTKTPRDGGRFGLVHPTVMRLSGHAGGNIHPNVQVVQGKNSKEPNDSEHVYYDKAESEIQLPFSISGRVTGYDKLSKSLRTQSGIRRRCPLTPLLFNLVTDEIMRRTLVGLLDPGVQITCDEKLVDVHYADAFLLSFEDEKA